MILFAMLSLQVDISIIFFQFATTKNGTLYERFLWLHGPCNKGLYLITILTRTRTIKNASYLKLELLKTHLMNNNYEYCHASLHS